MPPIRRWAAAALATLLVHHHAWAVLNIPNAPLQLMTGVDPNIMLLLDDSGSMQFEIMPDSEILGQTYYLYPPVSGVYGSALYTIRIPSFNTTNNPYGAIIRSPAFNTIYYNPAITYRPWLKHDGTSFPDATKTCAPHNPINTSLGCRDFTKDATSNTTWVTCSSASSCNTNTGNQTYWPATYFRYNGGTKWSSASYTRVEIRSGTATYSGDGRQNRSDCTNGVCTYEQEIKNFANWYTYYRSRILATRAGAGRVFATQGGNLRVGFATLNAASRTVDGVSTSSIVRGVRSFTGTDRQNFFSDLYGWDIPAAATPIRPALDAVGRYYSRSDDRGPWSTTPGQSGGQLLSCRRSFAVLMTDGYWNGDFASGGARSDNDSTNGPTHNGPDGRSYTYAARSPFRDGRSDTLADVAMYYWKNDLQPGLVNNVPTDPKDPAFWQHMVTMAISLGLSGSSIDPDAAFAAIDTGASIAWPDPQASDTSGGSAYPARLDDLLHATVNGRGAFVSAQNPSELEEGFRRALNDIANRSASGSGMAANARRLVSDTKVFQSEFNSSQWSGDLLAYRITAAGVIQPPVWRASEQLPAPSSRRIYTLNASRQGIEFTWSNLSSADRSAVGSEAILNYIRGDRTNEVANGGTLRNRAHPLADFINSEPLFQPLAGGAGIVYIGGNGGMLHAFDANSGRELFAYVPRALLSALPDLASTGYGHRFYVDGQLRLTTKNEFSSRTILVASAGRGAKGFFALDVSAPTNFGTANILWERLDQSATAEPDMGYVIGTFELARANNGRPVIITGNGYNSPNGKAVLFVIDAETGVVTRKIDTGVGGDNGMGPPTLVDEDGNGTVDTVYAGDLKGNLWKFNLSSGTPASWGNPISSNQPLFTATTSSGQAQPITAAPAWAMPPSYIATPLQGKRFVFVGTGSYFRNEDKTDTQTQSIYGVIDQGIKVSRSQLVQRASPSESTFAGETVRTFGTGSYNDYFNTSGQLTRYGWYIDFNTKPGERFILQPQIQPSRQLVLDFSSIIPSQDPCTPALSGYSNFVDPFIGGALSFGYADINRNNNFDDDKINSPSGTVFIGGRATMDPILGSNPIFAGGGTDPNTGPISGGSGLPTPQINRIARCEQLGTAIQASGGPNLLLRTYNCRSAWRELVD